MISYSKSAASAAYLLGVLAMAATSASIPAKAADQMHAGMVKCYGVAKAGKNDCAAGAHSCAGQATQDSDKASFVYVPQGVCEKLAGASLTSGK